MQKEIQDYNKNFVEEGRYKQFTTSKYPNKEIAILTCMDTRLVELLPAALGIHNGDVKMIKNAGAMITDPFDSVVRSLLVGIIELGVKEIMVIGHTDCGVSGISADLMVEELLKRGITHETIDQMQYCGINFQNWFRGFAHTDEEVRRTVNILLHHPLIPKDILIGGYIIDTSTGKLTELELD